MQCPTRFVPSGVEAGREHHAAPLCHHSLHPGQVGGQNQSRPKDVKEQTFILKLKAENHQIYHFLRYCLILNLFLRANVIHVHGIKAEQAREGVKTLAW